MINRDEGLIRSVGVWGLTANIMNIIIGAGIFALPALVAANMGPSNIIAYVFCGILVMLIMLCYAEVGSKITLSGGAYTYSETAFGPYVGFLVGAFYMISCILADATVANALVNIMGSAWPIFGEAWLRISVLVFIFSGLALVNVLGIKQGIGLVVFNTLVKLIPLVLLITIGWKNVDFMNLQWEGLPTIKQLGETSLILFFAFQGGDTALNISGEIVNPKRNIPKAIFVSISAVVIIYILIQMVSQGVLGDDLVNHKASPLAETAVIVFGTFGFAMLTIGAGVSMFGNLSGMVLNNPRVIYALARDKVLPIKPLARIHKRYATPYISILLYAGTGMVIAILGGFEQLITAASASLLIVYLAVALSVIRLRFSRKSESDEFKIPGGFTVPILACIIIVYFLMQSSNTEKIGALVLGLSITLFYFLIQVVKKKKKGG